MTEKRLIPFPYIYRSVSLYCRPLGCQGEVVEVDVGGFYLHRISSLTHVVVRLRFIGIGIISVVICLGYARCCIS